MWSRFLCTCQQLAKCSSGAACKAGASSLLDAQARCLMPSNPLEMFTMHKAAGHIKLHARALLFASFVLCARLAKTVRCFPPAGSPLMWWLDVTVWTPGSCTAPSARACTVHAYGAMVHRFLADACVVTACWMFPVRMPPAVSFLQGLLHCSCSYVLSNFEESLTQGLAPA